MVSAPEFLHSESHQQACRASHRNITEKMYSFWTWIGMSECDVVCICFFFFCLYVSRLWTLWRWRDDVNYWPVDVTLCVGFVYGLGKIKSCGPWFPAFRSYFCLTHIVTQLKYNQPNKDKQLGNYKVWLKGC